MAFLTSVGTTTSTNQNIATALLVHTQTNTTRIRKLFVNIFLDQVAGAGTYFAYLTVQRAGAGSAYTSIQTSLALASGVTSGFFASIPITLNATDVMKVYVIGLAGDTTTPDIIVDVNEEWSNIDASGRVDVGALLGTAVSTPATAGILDINVKNIVNVAAALDANNLLKVDTEDWKGGTIPAVSVTGVPLVDLKYILGATITGTAAQLVAAFTKFFNVATPTGTVNSLPDAVAGAAGGLAIVGSNVGIATSVSGAVGSVTGNVGGSVASVTAAVTVGTNNDKTGYGLSAAAVQAIWDALTSALTTAGSIGKRLADDIDATISSRTKPADTQARVTLVDTLTTYTGDTPQTGDSFARIGAAGAGLSAIPDSATLTEVGADVDELITSVAALPTTTLDAAGVRSAVGLASANLDTQLAEIEAETDGIAAIPTTPVLTAHFDTIIGTPVVSVSADIAEIEAETDAIQAKTDSLTFTIPLQVDSNALSGGTTAAGIRAAVGLASANLDTQLAEIEAETDDIAAVKAKTDQLVFTTPNQVDANALSGGGLSAAAIRAAVGLASANLDTQLAEIEAETDLIPTVGQIDTQLSGVHGAGVWGLVTATGPFALTLTITDSLSAAPLNQVFVQIKDAADTTLVNQSFTNASGVTVINLNAGTYKIHVGPLPGYSGAVATQVVSANVSVPLTLVRYVIGTPSAMNLCRVYGYEYLNGNPIKGRSVWAQLAGLPHATAGAVLDGAQADTSSDVVGYWFLDLVIGQSYRVSVQEAGVDIVVKVPDQSTLDLSTLI